jgi:hypothetical protein
MKLQRQTVVRRKFPLLGLCDVSGARTSSIFIRSDSTVALNLNSSYYSTNWILLNQGTPLPNLKEASEPGLVQDHRFSISKFNFWFLYFGPPADKREPSEIQNEDEITFRRKQKLVFSICFLPPTGLDRDEVLTILLSFFKHVRSSDKCFCDWSAISTEQTIIATARRLSFTEQQNGEAFPLASSIETF